MRILPDDALQRLSKRGVVGKAKGVKSSTPVEFVRGFGHNENLPTLYFFRKGQQGIITSTDDTLPLILVECDKADFSSDLPPSLEEWLTGMNEEINAYLQSDTQIDLTEDTSDNNRISVSPLIKSKWAQTAPFNDALLLDGKYRKVGCNAISLGQLLRYYGVEGIDGVQYKRGCKKTPAYTTMTLGIKVASLPPKAIFDYSRLTQKAPTATDSKNAVANFLAYCAKSITSDFKDTATAASPTYLSQQLKNCFKMGEVEMIFASKGAVTFEERIYNELVNGYPVILNGFNSTTGHSFLCDGYDADRDMFHFNLGWGGDCDGYYRMSAINPKKNVAYNDRKNAIIVHPMYQWGDVNGDGKVDITDVTKIVNDALNGNNRPESDINNDGKVEISDVTLLQNKLLGKGK